MKAKMATGERCVVFGPRLLHEIRMPVLYRGRLVGAVPPRRRRLESCQRNRRWPASASRQLGSSYPEPLPHATPGRTVS